VNDSLTRLRPSSESGVNITPLAEMSAPEAQVGEIVPAPSVISTIAPPTEASALPTIVSADAVPVEITETVTIVALSRRKHGFESPRERQLNQLLSM
jgi:hypothetical protein